MGRFNQAVWSYRIGDRRYELSAETNPTVQVVSSTNMSTSTANEIIRFPHENAKIAFKELFRLDLVDTKVEQSMWNQTWPMAFRFRTPGPDGWILSMTREMEEPLKMTRENMMEVAAELIHYHIERRFPNSVRRVEMQRDTEHDKNLIAVTFKNGHVLKSDSYEAFKDDFLAQVAMVWDLPQLGKE